MKLFQKNILFTLIGTVLGLYGNDHPTTDHQIYQTDYLIIAPDSFRIQAERLADYRSQGGLTPKIILLDTLCSDSSGGIADSCLKAQIGQYWFDNYLDLKYVVILGDWVILPPHTGQYIGGLAYSDYWFTTDLDTTLQPVDSLYCSIGRVPAESNEQLSRYIDRVIEYETQLDILPWEQNILAVAGNRNSDWPSCIFDNQLLSLKDPVENAGMSYKLISRCPESDYYEPSQTNTLSEFTSGDAILFYYGFNDQNIWEYDSLFNYETISAFNFWQYSPVIFTNGNHQFAFRDSLSSVAKKMIMENETGPVTILSSPNLLSLYNTHSFYQQLITDMMVTNDSRIGDYLKMADDQVNFPTLFKFQLFGDPALIPKFVNDENPISQPLYLKMAIDDQDAFITIFPQDEWTQFKVPLAHYQNIFQENPAGISIDHISLTPYFNQAENITGNVLIDNFAIAESYNQNFDAGFLGWSPDVQNNELSLTLTDDSPYQSGNALNFEFGQSENDTALSKVIVALDSVVNITLNDTIEFWIKQGEVIMATDPNLLQNPQDYKLHIPYPNPFNAVTRLTFQLPRASLVKLFAYDITGRQVWESQSQQYPAGPNSLIWQPQNLSSGIYFIRMEAGRFQASQKVLMVK